MHIPEALLVCVYAIGLSLTLLGLLLLADVILIGITNEDDCNETCSKNQNCCVLWTGGLCWRGTPGNKPLSCTKQSITVPIILLSIGGVLAFGGLIWFSLSGKRFSFYNSRRGEALQTDFM